MQKAVLNNIKELVIVDSPKPNCPEDGLLVTVKACAVCATDVKIYNYGHLLVHLPRVLGHEIAGVIDEVGPKMQDRFRKGQRVAVCAVINCCECTYCQRGIASMCLNLKAFGYHFDGGYQEYMAVPHEAIRCGGVNELADNLSYSEAAVAELIACCINGQRLSRFKLGQSVLIIGAGPVGILHAQLARYNGASQIYLADIEPRKLEQSKNICGDSLTGIINNRDSDEFLKNVYDMTSGQGFDQVMVCCSASQAQQQALDCVAKCGCVNFFGGLPKGNSHVLLDTNHIHYKQCSVVGTHGSSAQDNRIALELISAGRINAESLITDKIDLTRLESFLDRKTPNDASLKTIVEF